MAFTFQINDDVEWNHDEALLKKANRNIPKLIKTVVRPTRLVEIVADEASINGFKAISSEKKIENLDSYKLKRNDHIIFDLGDHYVGRFSIDIKSVGSPMDSPLYVHVKFAEVAAEIKSDSKDYDGWLSKAWIQEEYIHVDVLPFTMEMPRRYSCRYIELEVLDTSPKWQVSFRKPKFVSESSVELKDVKGVQIEDRELTSIYDVSLKTLQDCMQTVFEDGPKRDRRLWIGDLRLQALANYATFDDVILVKRCMYLFGGMTTKGGKVPANVFTIPELTPDDTFLLDYSLFFAVILFDYIEHTDDKEVLEDLYPIAKKEIDLVLNQVDKEGRLVIGDDWPVFIDWSNDFDKTTAGQGVLIYSLKCFIGLSKRMNDKDYDNYRMILDRLINFSKSTLFDSKKDQFIIEKNGEINVASQVWMVLAGVMNNAENKKIMNKTIQDQFPITGIATPYMYHHVTEALFIVGLDEDAIKLMKNYWGKMISMGADTFWEAFKPEEPNFSPYGNPIISSYCHAWSCTPAYLIKKYVLKK